MIRINDFSRTPIGLHGNVLTGELYQLISPGCDRKNNENNCIHHTE